jgi:hypothetical protein
MPRIVESSKVLLLVEYILVVLCIFQYDVYPCRLGAPRVGGEMFQLVQND